ncbi:hypothetical protein X948_5422 [Burkholderia pseudomallei MSHR5608]|nr:hypothetical protein X948_5422 [Burkholderia pseudomallei MSHR5608]
MHAARAYRMNGACALDRMPPGRRLHFPCHLHLRRSAVDRRKAAAMRRIRRARQGARATMPRILQRIEFAPKNTGSNERRSIIV